MKEYLVHYRQTIQQIYAAIRGHVERNHQLIFFPRSNNGAECTCNLPSHIPNIRQNNNNALCCVLDSANPRNNSSVNGVLCGLWHPSNNLGTSTDAAPLPFDRPSI